MDGTAQQQAWSLLQESMTKEGRPYADVGQFKKWMEEGGFTNVVEKRFVWPMNQWPKDPCLKELGSWNLVNVREGTETFLLATLTRILGWKKEDVQVLAAKVRAELGDRRIHAYNPM